MFIGKTELSSEMNFLVCSFGCWFQPYSFVHLYSHYLSLLVMDEVYGGLLSRSDIMDKYNAIMMHSSLLVDDIASEIRKKSIMSFWMWV